MPLDGPDAIVDDDSSDDSSIIKEWFCCLNVPGTLSGELALNMNKLIKIFLFKLNWNLQFPVHLHPTQLHLKH